VNRHRVIVATRFSSVGRFFFRFRTIASLFGTVFFACANIAIMSRSQVKNNNTRAEASDTALYRLTPGVSVHIMSSGRVR
jgi:hypothetical protein